MAKEELQHPLLDATSAPPGPLQDATEASPAPAPGPTTGPPATEVTQAPAPAAPVTAPDAAAPPSAAATSDAPPPAVEVAPPAAAAAAAPGRREGAAPALAVDTRRSQQDGTDASDLPTPLRQMPSLRPWEANRSPGALEDHYSVSAMLGDGSFGQVLTGECIKTRQRRAIKVIPMDVLKSDWLLRQLEREVSICGLLQHPYIVHMYESFRDESCTYLVMQLCRGPNLRDKVLTYPQDPDERDTRRGLPMVMVAQFLWQMLMGIAYLHHHGIVHRDIKPENYLQRDDSNYSPLVLIDFGFACRFERGQMLTEGMGSPYSSAPEIIEGKPYNEKCDVYSVGVTTYFATAGQMPFNGQSIQEVMEKVKTGRVHMDENDWRLVSPYYSELVRELLAKEPARRPSAKAVIARRDSWLRLNGWNRHELDPANWGEEASQGCVVS